MKFFVKYFFILAIVPSFLSEKECTRRENFSRHFGTLSPYVFQEDTTDFNIPKCSVEKIWFVVQYGGSKLASNIEKIAETVSSVVRDKISKSSEHNMCTEDFQSLKDWSYEPRDFSDKLVKTFANFSSRYTMRFYKTMRRMYSSAFKFEFNRNVPQVNETLIYFLKGWLGTNAYKVLQFPEYQTIPDFMEDNLDTETRKISSKIMTKVNERLGILLDQQEISAFWDMCRFEQSNYNDKESSPICSIFDENDVLKLEEMENESSESESSKSELMRPVVKHLIKDFSNAPSVVTSSFFTTTTVFRMILKEIGIQVNENRLMSIAANLVIVKYKCLNPSQPIRFFLNEKEVYTDACGLDCTFEKFAQIFENKYKSSWIEWAQDIWSKMWA